MVPPKGKGLDLTIVAPMGKKPDAKEEAAEDSDFDAAAGHLFDALQDGDKAGFVAALKVAIAASDDDDEPAEMGQ